jgi:hypothetical protein
LAAKYIFATLAFVFLAFGGARLVRDKGVVSAAARTWLLVGVIFGAVGVYLWAST